MEFTSRLQMLLDYYNLSASGFAHKIGIQRSSMSHVLSGRNKPSLDFVMKVLHTFKEVSIEWLVDGHGDFPKQSQPKPSSIPNPKPNAELFETKMDSVKTVDDKTIESPAVTPPPPAVNINPILNPKSKKNVVRVIICFDDNTFESYETE